MLRGYGSADATASPSSLCFMKIQNGSAMILEKRPLNGCSSSSSSSASSTSSTR